MHISVSIVTESLVETFGRDGTPPSKYAGRRHTEDVVQMTYIYALHTRYCLAIVGLLLSMEERERQGRYVVNEALGCCKASTT